MPESSRESEPSETHAPGGRGSGRGLGRRKRYTGRDLTKGSIPGNLWYLSWPQITESFLSVIDHVADLIWAGRIGFQAIAGLGLAQPFLMMLITARVGLDAGMRSMISRAVGARKIAHANHVLLQSLTLTTVYSVLMVIVGITVAEPLIRLMGVGDEVVSQAAGYMRFQLFAMSMMGIQRVTGGSLQAAGDSITPLKATSVSRVTHLVLSPFLIFGWWWFPSLDLAGAGAANLIAQVLGASMNMSALVRGTSRLRLSFKGYYVDYHMIWQILKIGIPASVTGAQRSVSQLIVVFIVAPFGDGALAAFAVSRRAENTVNHASRGLGRAAGTLAGQNLGIGQKSRARQAVNWALAYAGVTSLIVSALFLVFSEYVATFFNSDPEFVARTTTWLQVLAVGYFSMNAVQVFTQAFNTTGDTFAPMVIMLSTMWLIEIPLAFALANFTGLQEFGVPWAIVIGMTVRMAAFGVYFLQGRWLRTGL